MIGSGNALLRPVTPLNAGTRQATTPYRQGTTINQHSTPMAMTALTGTRLLVASRYTGEPVTARSRDNANFIGAAEVTEAVPQKKCATTAMNSRSSAKALPIGSVQM